MFWRNYRIKNFNNVNPDGSPYVQIIDDFNEYSLNNNLNIIANLILDMQSLEVNYFESMVESLLIRKSTKYDIYIYDNSSTQKYGKYLLDLNNRIPDEHIKLYHPDIIDGTCIYKNKLVGIPFSVGFSFLFSNIELLNKYNKPIPETWDELIETSEYIMERERQLNNTDLIAYNGLFDETSHGEHSVFEYIYTCRNSSLSSNFPDYRSEEFIEALKQLKKIKEKISSDEIFQNDSFFTMKLLNEVKAIFVKFYSINFPSYKMTVLPGIKKGISGSSIVGYNIGISDAISEVKKKASLEVLKYLTSKKMQKQYILQGYTISGIPSLYYDEDVCNIVDCEAYRNIQPLVRNINTYPFDNMDYNKRYTKYVYDYLYKNSSISETIKFIDDITKIYNISLDTKDSSLGLIMFIILISVMVLMLASLLLLYVKKYSIYFSFLSKDFWFIFILGLYLLLCTGFTRMGTVTVFKCFLYPTSAIFGFSLTIIPVLHKMIVYFPEENKISIWIEEHRYIFLLSFMVIDAILITIFYFNEYDVKPVILIEGQNSEACQLNNVYGKVFLCSVIGYKLLILIFIVLLIYIEWNIIEIHTTIQGFTSVIYIDVFSLLILRIVDYISVNNYKTKYLIKVIIMLIVVIANYILIYALRFLISFIKEDHEKIKLNINTVYGLGDNKINGYYSSNISSEISNSNTDRSFKISKGNISSRSSLVSKIVEYHNKSSIKN